MNNAKYNENEATAAYVDFYIENLAELAEATQFIPLNDDQYSETQSALEGIGRLTTDRRQKTLDVHHHRRCRLALRGGPAARRPLAEGRAPAPARP